MKNFVLFLIPLSCLLAPAFTTPVSISKNDFSYLFNHRLTESEKSALQNGEFVFNSISSVKNVRVNHTKETEQDIETVKNVNPNHLVEVIKILPYAGNENLIETIALIMQDIDAYTEIPYYSQRHERTYRLFVDAEILSTKQENGILTIDERLLMDPFKPYTARVEAENRGDYYFYTLKNTERVKYLFLNAIKKEKMIAGVSVFRCGENWVIYALGGAYVFHGPFFSDFIESEFCGRIKSFVIFMFTRLEEFQKSESHPKSDAEN